MCNQPVSRVAQMGLFCPFQDLPPVWRLPTSTPRLPPNVLFTGPTSSVVFVPLPLAASATTAVEPSVPQKSCHSSGRRPRSSAKSAKVLRGRREPKHVRLADNSVFPAHHLFHNFLNLLV